MSERSNSLSKKSNTEHQRYGRNKDYTVNHTYLLSGDYKRKFDSISDNPKLNTCLYQIAKLILKHRSGTKYEDMYWINAADLTILAQETDSHKEKSIKYSKRTQKFIKNAQKQKLQVITIHSHPDSFPPSIEDLNSNYEHEYLLGIICCHDGKIFTYSSEEYINKNYFHLCVSNYKKNGHNDYEAQMMALDKIQKRHNIYIKEVI